jgi:threonylcarbamoyladenosine tRNA methylthiotransferase MtaB
MTPPTYRIETLGCKANLYDSRRLAEALEALGFRHSEDGQRADVCVLNTCTVTAVADRKGRQLAARLARRNPGARLFVTGCGAATDRERLAAVEGVEAVFGREEWDGLLRALGGHEAAEGAACSLAAGGFGIRSFAGRARAFLKVQEGCDAACSYCILPRVRGTSRSRPLDDAAAEAGRLVEAGFAELVLTGIHLGLCGRDLPGGEGLAGLVRAVAAVPGLGRLRLSSVEVAEVDGDLLDAMRHPAVCAHLHIPLQSGDPEVLRQMNRRYGPEEFLRAAELARARAHRPRGWTGACLPAQSASGPGGRASWAASLPPGGRTASWAVRCGCSSRNARRRACWPATLTATCASARPARPTWSVRMVQVMCTARRGGALRG